LLSEFRAVIEHLKIDSPTIDEIATAVGINRSNTLPNYTLAACVVAAQKLAETYRPLIEELCSRASYILSRLPQIADSIIIARRKTHRSTLNKLTETTVNDLSATFSFMANSNSPLTPINGNLNLNSYIHNSTSGKNGSLVDSYYKANTYFQFRAEPDYLEEKQIVDVEETFPYFHFHIRDLYYKFIQTMIGNAKQKCLNEFLSEGTIYWNFLSENKERAHNAQDASQLARTIIDQHQAALAKTTLLKFHQFFLVQLQRTLWSTLNGQYLSLSDNELEQKFELKATQDKLTRKQKKLEQALLQYIDVENVFFEANKKIFHHYPLSTQSPPSSSSSSSLSSSAGTGGGGSGSLPNSGSVGSLASSSATVGTSSEGSTTSQGHVRTASSSSNISMGDGNDDE